MLIKMTNEMDETSVPSYIFILDGNYYRTSEYGGLEQMALCECGRWMAEKTLRYSQSRYKHEETKVHRLGVLKKNILPKNKNESVDTTCTAVRQET